MAKAVRARVVYEFGPFRVDPAESRLVRGSVPVPLSPKALETLVALVSRPGRLVEKAELLGELWPDTAVEESSLSQHVYLVRKALGDERGEARWIETVPKRGYRFVGAVRVVAAGVDAATPAGPPPAAPTAGPWAGREVTSDGAAVDSVAGGSAPPARARRPVAVAGAILALIALGVAAAGVVNGAWPRRGPPRDAAAGPARVAQPARVAPGQPPAGGAAQATVGRAARTPASPEAYDAYVRGLSFWSQRTAEGLQKATRCFEEAVRHAPDYAPAWAGLADARALAATLRYGPVPPEQAFEKARAAAIRALQLDGTLAEAHIALALIRAHDQDGRRDAEAEYQIALALDPRSATALQRYAGLLVEDGRLGAATEITGRALALDPRSPALNANLCYLLYLRREYRRAAGYCDKAVEIQPDLTQPLTTRALIEVQAGRLEAALALLGQARPRAEGTGLLAVLEAQGYTLARAGRPDLARAALREIERLTRDGDPERINMLGIHAALGDTERAFELLRSCARSWQVKPFALAFDPRYDALRRDPRYAEVMSRSAGAWLPTDSTAGGTDGHETRRTLF